MTKAQKIKYYMDGLCIFDFEEDDIFSALYDLLSSDDEDKIAMQGAFFRELTSAPSLKAHISELILTADNIFTRQCCAGKADELGIDILNAVISDLSKLEKVASITAQDVTADVDDDDVKKILLTMPGWEVGKALPPLTTQWERHIDSLAKYYRKNGCGVFAKHNAFIWRDEELCPVAQTDPITLSDLKNYEEQRQRVIDNTESFLAGHPANNVLLYGDRGTGKSSTVHAVLNEYCSKGLRMIEVPRNELADLPLIRTQLENSPMKFIIYIDDLSFDTNDELFNGLKAALEGSLSHMGDNILIYATSNRRHLIRESFSDRDNDVNRNDIMQEQLSLSDRFGLTITFLNPNKNEYLDIVCKIAQDRGLCENVDMQKLMSAADRWATRRAGRSPRCAKQFVDYVQSCEARGIEW